MPPDVSLPAKIMVRMPEAELHRLRTLARRDERAPSALARRFIIDGLRRLEDPDAPIAR